MTTTLSEFHVPQPPYPLFPTPYPLSLSTC